MTKPSRTAPLWRGELLLLLALVTAVLGFSFEHALVSSGVLGAGLAALLLFAVVIGASLRVAHHAEMLAIKLGEPYGTMILTLSAVLVEVVILAVLMLNGASPTLARDTVYSAIMLDVNGILGLAALIGGLRHGEQKYNVDSGNSYVAMILTALGIAMIAPEFIPRDRWQAYSVFSIGVMILLYGLFIRLQTGRHSYFFDYAYPEMADHGHEPERIRVAPHAALLVLSILLIGVLAEILAACLDVALAGSGMPAIVPAVLVATISASPEILTALRAATANRMQAVVNIALGASLATVVLTVPVIEGIALFTGQPIVMALTPIQTAMLFITLLACAINLNDGETNAIEGMIHFALFLTFVMLAALGV